MTAAVLTALFLSASPADMPLHVQIADTISCPSAAQLLDALDQRLGPGRAVLGGSGQGVTMEVFATEGGRFTVRLTSTQVRLTAEQTLDAHRGSCVELARAVALLAESWLRDMPSEKDLMALTPPPEPEPAPHPPPAATPAVVKPVPHARPQAHTPLVAFSVAYDQVVSTTSGPGVSATLEFALPSRFGLGAEFSYLPPLSGSDPLLPGGTITIRRWSGALVLTYLLAGSRSDPGFSATAVAGGLVLRASAQASGNYNQPNGATNWQFGGLLGLRGNYQFNRLWFVYGEVDGQAVLHPLNFQVCDAAPNQGTCTTTVVTQPAWWLSFSGGIGVRFL